MAEKSLSICSVEEYLRLEEESEVRNEFERGRIIVMSGGSLDHGIVGNNINTELNNAVRRKDLNGVAINGDVKIFIEKAESFLYPDGMVICGEVQTSEKDKNSAINPILIVEVLSRSTERYDRGDKFHKYCSLPSF